MSQKEPFTWRRAAAKQATPASTQAVASPPSPKAVPSVSRHIPEHGTTTPVAAHAPSPAAAAPTRAEPTHEQIATRAYDLWETHGYPHGDDREHWLQAERELKAEAR